MAMEEPVKEDVVSFAQINKDMDQPALGCTSPAMACHGGAMPVGILKLQSGAQTDGTKLMANFTETTAMPRVNPAMPAESTLLTKPLATRMDVAHMGGKSYFASDQDPIYVRWLKWVRCGAKFEEVMVSTCPGGM